MQSKGLTVRRMHSSTHRPQPGFKKALKSVITNLDYFTPCKQFAGFKEEEGLMLERSTICCSSAYKNNGGRTHFYIWKDNSHFYLVP